MLVQSWQDSFYCLRYHIVAVRETVPCSGGKLWPMEWSFCSWRNLIPFLHNTKKAETRIICSRWQSIGSVQKKTFLTPISSNKAEWLQGSRRVVCNILVSILLFLLAFLNHLPSYFHPFGGYFKDRWNIRRCVRMDRALSMHAWSSTSLIYPLAKTLLWESAIKNRDLPCLQIRGLPYLWNSVRDKVREDRVDSNWFKREAHKIKSLIQSEIWELPTIDWHVSWQFRSPFTWWLCYDSFLFLYELSSDFQILTLPLEIISDLKKKKKLQKIPRVSEHPKCQQIV